MAGCKKIFTDEEIQILLQNPYVLKVTRHTINFTVEFKRYVYYELLKGRKTSEILRELGIDPRMLGIGRVNMLKMNLFKEAGSPRGLHDVGENKAYVELAGKIRRLEAELAYKNQEIEFLKNYISNPNDPRGAMSVSASAKFAIIYEMMQREDNLLDVKTLCDSAGVSRSGYYRYLSAEETRKQREEEDRADFELILEAYKYRGYAKEARGIHMRLLRMTPPINMNLKKIRRLMKKYGLRCPIRKPNPYRRIAKNIKSATIVPNILNREFESRGARSVLLTDITYIINGRAPQCYMSTVIDGCTKEVLAWVLSPSLQEEGLSLETIYCLLRDHGVTLSTEALIHSDQGVHYRSVKFIQLLKDSNLCQSMSRRANCWDNAPQESFFGHMKDEIDISGCTTFEEVYNVISEWVHYYNNDRPQWDLLKLAPAEYYQYLMTGEYPLEKIQNKDNGEE